MVFCSHLKDLNDMVSAENTCIHPFLPHINSLLNNAILTCKAAVLPNTSIDVVSFVSDKIAANKLLENINGVIKA